MALVVEVRINDTRLYTVGVQRQHWEARALAEYKVTVWNHEEHTETTLPGTLLHKPGDGAVALAREALAWAGGTV